MNTDLKQQQPGGPIKAIVRQVVKVHYWLAGKTGYDLLPERARHAIDQHQQASEKLIGWVQLTIVLVFAILYAVSPKTFSSDAAFEPVPWVLSLYLLFTLLRMILAHRNRLPYWMLVTSVVVDMSLLLALIWSFHLQYEQPASFYLKAPTLLYVFIFISLRALRFEVGFVVLSGLIAAFGWLLMVLYVVTVDPDETMITRDYIEYMTSNSVLLGAEFDKVISILVVTAILTVAISRAHRLLIFSTTESYAAAELSRFVPSQVARQITTSREQIHVGESTLAETTILFIDLAGFTSIGESMPPQKLIETLNEYFKLVAKPIEKYKGVINQFQGDAILASFNLPEPHPDHADNAIYSALAILSLLDQHTFANGIRLQARIGINTGIVVGGLVGTPDRLNYTVHGDDVNLAARLEQLNKEFGTSLLVSENTRVKCRPGLFDFQSITTTKIRGRQADVSIYTIQMAS